MASPTDVIADAFQKLKRSISEDDAYNFASTELQDVWNTVRAIDSEQRKRQSAQNLRRLDPLLRGLENYRKVIEVLCNGTPYMPYIWAPIKLMLEIASHHRDVFEALLSAYADIAAALPRFDRYNKTFHDNLEFQHALAAVYSGILEFHQRAYKFFRRRAWHVIFLSLWKDFGARFDCIINSLKKQRDFVDIEAASFHIVEQKESRSKLHEGIQHNTKLALAAIEQSEKQARISQFQHSIAWLGVDERVQEPEYERLSKRRHDKTCEWIVKEANFEDWIRDDLKRSCLWLDGKPGSGKSVMCSYLIQKLTDIPDLTVSYYFCNSNDTGKVCGQILTTVVLHILRQHPDTAALITNDFVYRGLGCGMPQLKTLIPKLLQLIGYTRIIVDGIDECSKENQKSIMKELQPLFISGNCKILFSSRKEVHIREKLSKQPRVSLDGRPEVDQDIRTFIKHKLAKLCTSDQDLLDRIEAILVGRANGMFLWVRLVINELKYCYSDAAMEETVTNLPRGLKAAYGRILDRIMDPTNPQNAKYMAIRILGWMACSYRALKCYELLDGIAFDATNTILNSKTRIRREILDLCRPLIEDSPTGTIDFVHFSAKEYILEEAYQASRPLILRENAHLDISLSCISFLASSLALLPTNCTDSERAAIIVHGFHGLHIYADHFWYKHLLEYCDLLHRHNRQISPGLLVQLKKLLNYKKAHPDSFTSIVGSGEIKLFTKPPCLDVLNHAPEVKDLVLGVLEFRSRPDLAANHSDENLDAISLAICDTDPTHFSAARQSYQRTTESLLRDDALVLFPQIELKDLEAFRDTYGSTAFLCRYPGCDSNTDGFETSGQRTQHESKHQRQFRCEFSTCFSFTTGFATRGLLNRHNDKWHSAVVGGLSLAQSLKAASPVSVHGNTVSRIPQDGNLDIFDGFFSGSADNLDASHAGINGQPATPLANTNVVISQQLDQYQSVSEKELRDFDSNVFLREGDDVEKFNLDTDPLAPWVPLWEDGPETFTPSRLESRGINIYPQAVDISALGQRDKPSPN